MMCSVHFSELGLFCLCTELCRERSKDTGKTVKTCLFGTLGIFDS